MTPRQRQNRLSSRWPTIWLLTDERISQDALMAAIARLPRGSGVIVRHYSLAPAPRRQLFRMVHAQARRRAIRVLLAGTEALARAWGADGVHGPRSPRRAAPPGWLRSMAVHDLPELRCAHAARAGQILLSPLFATRSHPGAGALGTQRFGAIARWSKLPVIALGGMTRHRFVRAAALGASGWAAIDGLVSPAR